MAYGRLRPINNQGTTTRIVCSISRLISRLHRYHIMSRLVQVLECIDSFYLHVFSHSFRMISQRTIRDYITVELLYDAYALLNIFWTKFLHVLVIVVRFIRTARMSCFCSYNFTSLNLTAYVLDRRNRDSILHPATLSKCDAL